MDFIVAFYACMYIGAVAVPVDFPTDPSNIEKWELIAKKIQVQDLFSLQKKNLPKCFAKNYVII